ncbi:MAG: sigma-70 family RNA polymerase sigma factor [Chloroflexia bacterium]|nr:sigma-70 family RNA polymerase sigma factor [Chloroflexia bacterium]
MLPAATRDDEALIRASQAGDLEAFNLLVQRHERPVFNVALRLLRDVGLAEDATQDTFIRAWQNIRTFQTGSVRSWLYKIATNRSYDMLRASARRPAGSLEAEMVEIEPIWASSGHGEESPDAHALRRELSIYLERALTALPDDQRMVVLLVDVQGLDYHEVAETMGIALGTVKSRLSRARAKIRQALADDAPARELFERYLRLEGEDAGDWAVPVTPTMESDR